MYFRIPLHTLLSRPECVALHEEGACVFSAGDTVNLLKLVLGGEKSDDGLRGVRGLSESY